MPGRIRFVVGDDGPSGFFRLASPCETLRAAGDDVGFAIHYEDFEAADILIFQRQHSPAAIAEIMRWKERGKKIVVDFDDNFFQMDAHNQANAFYTPEIVDDLQRLIGAVDAVTVSTQPLAEVYRAYSDNVLVLPNALPKRAFDLQAKSIGQPVVGWQGSASHHDDLKLLKSPITSVSRKYDFDFVLAGYRSPGLFKHAIFREWVRFSPDLSYFSAFADFTIGLCPLAKTRFNDGKSDLKWLEYSALGIPTVASSLAPYQEIEDGVTGFLARNAGDWEKRVSALLEDVDLRRRLGDSAREYVREHRTIEGNIDLWRRAYASL